MLVVMSIVVLLPSPYKLNCSCDCIVDNYSIFLAQLTEKLSKIASIWSTGRGVLSLHLFTHTTAHEALTREAAMIDAIGEHP